MKEGSTQNVLENRFPDILMVQLVSVIFLVIFFWPEERASNSI